MPFLCSSSLSCLLEASEPCSLDVESSIRYLFVGQPLSGRTLAREISKVKAAHCLHWHPGGALIAQRYYTPLRLDAVSAPDSVARSSIQSALDRAISETAKGKRKALLLSGGVDSSYIAATLAAQKSGLADAFTIAFEGLPDANETQFASLVAGKLKMRHFIVPLSLSDAVMHLNAILDSAEPCSAWAAITHRQLLQCISSHSHTRLVSGLGADEIFGGYAAYLRSYAQFRLYEKEWQATLVPCLNALLSNPTEAQNIIFSGVPRFFDSRSLKASLHSPFNQWNPLLPDVSFYRLVQTQKSHCHYFEMMIAHECEHRIPDLLFCGFEPISRAHTISTLYPFLDAGVVEAAIGLSAIHRFQPDGSKWKNKVFLREIASAKLPPEVLARTPMSYNAPIVPWLGSRPFAKSIIDRLHSSAFLNLGIVRNESVARIQKGVLRCINGRANCNPANINELWALLTLCAWYDRWIRR